MNPSAPDQQRAAASDPGTPLRVLTDLAAGRWDLHGLIAANPASSPELVRWIMEVNPALSVQQPSPFAARPAAYGLGPPRTPRRRPGTVAWLMGCGFLAVAAFMAVVVIAGLGAVLSSEGGSPTGPAQPTAADSAIEAQIARYQQERTRIDELAVAFDGTAVASLVAWFEWLHRQDERMADPALLEYTAQTIATQTTTFREELEASIVAAKTRRKNRSGSVTERIVDRAGKGFIGIRWDAATACKAEVREGWRRIGCVKKGDSLTVHLLPERELGRWGSTRAVVHELAHVYQRADKARSIDNKGDYEALLAKGMFQGSLESMADCFSMTYYDEWTLSRDGQSIGYGYVCNKKERRAIRRWAASIGAPLR